MLRLSQLQKRNFFRIVNENQRGVRLIFGKFDKVLEPGIRLSIPIIHQFDKVDIRDQMSIIPQQQLISKDNVSLTVDASVQYRVSDVYKAYFKVEDYEDNVIERCKMQIRDVLSSMEVNEILHNKSEINNKFMDKIGDIKDDWGITISRIQLQDISFDESVKRSMAMKAEADRNAEAKIINARADTETAKQYAEAAKIYAENPITMRLREFQLWSGIANKPNNTFFVIPSNLLDFINKKHEKKDK